MSFLNRLKVQSNEPRHPIHTCQSCRSFMELTQIATETSTTIYEISCWNCGAITELESSQVKPKDNNNTKYSTSSSGPSSSTPYNKKSNRKGSVKPYNFTGKTGTDDQPLDMEYYRILDVEANATPAQIKKAYYQMAMKAHPDKNRDDPEADEKFKKVSEAYQVLFDPKRRAHYNQYGKVATGSEGAFIDPEEFFKQQFGGDKFVDFIGEISIAKDFKEAMKLMQQQDDDNKNTISADPNISSVLHGGMSLEERTAIREERIKKLVVNLKDKLSLYTDAWPMPSTVHGENPIGSSDLQLAQEALDTFTTISAFEANKLKSESYGVELLNAIGYVYLTKAEQWLSKIDTEEGHIFKKVWGFGNRLTSFATEKSHIFKETVGTFRTALDLQTSFAKLQDMEKKKEDRKSNRSEGCGTADGNDESNVEYDGLTPEERELKAKLEYEAATKGLETLWRGSKLEVEAVLRQVCDDVLGDEKIPPVLRRRRAEGLKAMGQVFKSVRRDEVVTVSE